MGCDWRRRGGRIFAGLGREDGKFLGLARVRLGLSRVILGYSWVFLGLSRVLFFELSFCFNNFLGSDQKKVYFVSASGSPESGGWIGLF
jgi:hypothetical protein